MRLNKIKFIFGLAGGLTMLLAIFYFFQLSSLTRTMYLIKGYSSKMKSVSGGNNVLEVKASQAASLENLKPLVDALNFDKAGRVDYIRVPAETVVAVK